MNQNHSTAQSRRSRPTPSFVRFILGGILLIQLSACTTPHTPADSDAPKPPITTTGWSTNGKASITGPDGTETVNVRWQRGAPERENVLLSGPAGLGATALERIGEQIFWRENGKLEPINTLPLTADGAAVAASLPVLKLGDWLLGYPPIDGNWQVTIDQWQATDSWRVPRKLMLTNGVYRVRLVLLEWQFDPGL